MFTYFFFFFNDTATTEIYTLSLHDALPICVLMTAQLRRIVLSTASAAVLACVIGRTGPAAQAPRPTGGPIAIVGARLIDGTGTAPVERSGERRGGEEGRSRWSAYH